MADDYDKGWNKGYSIGWDDGYKTGYQQALLYLEELLDNSIGTVLTAKELNPTGALITAAILERVKPMINIVRKWKDKALNNAKHS